MLDISEIAVIVFKMLTIHDWLAEAGHKNTKYVECTTLSYRPPGTLSISYKCRDSKIEISIA